MSLVTIFFERAKTMRDRSRFREAARLYGRILSRRGLTPLQKAEAHLGAGDCLRLQGDFRGAKRHAKAAEALFKKTGSPRRVDASVSLALAARASGEPRHAAGLLSQALKFYRADGDDEGIAFAHWALGGTLRIAGDLKGGWKHLSTAEKAFQRLGDREGSAYNHCALGGLARMFARIPVSKAHYRAANRLHRSRRDSFGTAYSYCGLGNVERMGGRYEAAMRYFKKAEKLYRRIGDKVSYAYTLWSIGTAHKMMGDHAAAKKRFDAADRLFQTTGDLRGRSYAALGRAELSWLLGKNGEPERKKAEAFAKAGGYAWEFLHARMMKGGKVSKEARAAYRKAGSRFVPAQPPINWP